MSAERELIRKCFATPALIVLITISICSAGMARAQHVIGQFPTSGFKPSGFAMTVSIPNSSRVGICPVTVDIRSIGPSFPADRTLTLELRPRSIPASGGHFDFRTEIELHQGDSSYNLEYEVPVYYDWRMCRVRVLEDDVELPGYDMSTSKSVSGSRGLPHAFTIGVLEARTQDAKPSDELRFPDCRLIQLFYGLDGNWTNQTATPGS